MMHSNSSSFQSSPPVADIATAARITQFKQAVEMTETDNSSQPSTLSSEELAHLTEQLKQLEQQSSQVLHLLEEAERTKANGSTLIQLHHAITTLSAAAATQLPSFASSWSILSIEQRSIGVRLQAHLTTLLEKKKKWSRNLSGVEGVQTILAEKKQIWNTHITQTQRVTQIKQAVHILKHIAHLFKVLEKTVPKLLQEADEEEHKLQQEKKGKEATNKEDSIPSQVLQTSQLLKAAQLIDQLVRVIGYVGVT